MSELASLNNHTNNITTNTHVCNWRNRSYMESRKIILKEIIKILFLRNRERGFNSDIEKIMKIAKKIESRLYSTASNFEEYSAKETLEKRLAVLARQISISNNRTMQTNMQEEKVGHVYTFVLHKIIQKA